MRPETFLEKFDLIADAPGSVAKMRELVLELAVQGKLVRQDANDEPAIDLLHQIEIARNQTGKKPSGRKPEEQTPVEPNDSPFEIPQGWEWCRLGTLGLVGSSCRVHQKDWTSSGVPFLRAREIVKLSKTGQVDNDLFITEEHYQRLASDGLTPATNDIMITGVGTIGVPYLVRNFDRFYFKDASVLILKNCFHLYPHYLHAVMQSPYWVREVHRESMGTTVHTLTIVRAKQTPIPLPPLAEQKRIVAKVDELMALCDRLEQQQNEREARHATLSRASLTRFSEAPTPENLHYLFHPTYTTTPTDLRKTILTLAVQGKLVPQDPNDESADQLCEPDDEIAADSSFELPHGWIWTRLAKLGDINGGFAFKSTAYTEQGTRVIRISDFDEFGFKDHKVVRHPFSADLQKFTLNEQNILMAMTGGTVGKSYLVRSMLEPMVVNQRVATIKVLASALPSYIDIVIRSEMTQEVIRRAKNSTNDNISMGDIKGFSIPLPPLAEQKRIVAKVDELMKLVDQLEAQLTGVRTAAENLLNALLADLTSQKAA